MGILYNDIVGTIRNELGEADIEAVLSVLDGLMDYRVFNELSLFVTRRLLKESIHLLDTERYRDIPKLQALENRLHSSIRYSCRIRSQFRCHVKDVYVFSWFFIFRFV